MKKLFVVLFLVIIVAASPTQGEICKADDNSTQNLKKETNFCFPLDAVHTGGWILWRCPKSDIGPRVSRYYVDVQPFMDTSHNGRYHVAEDWNGRGWGGTGLDETGDSVYAIGDGKVVHTGSSNSWGKGMVIEHLYGVRRIRSVYAHLDDFAENMHGDAIEAGDCVSRGQIIGYVGQTGSAATGPHLHFEIRRTPFPDEPFGVNTYVADPKNPVGNEPDPAHYHDPTEFILRNNASEHTYHKRLIDETWEDDYGCVGVAFAGCGGGLLGPRTITLDPVSVTESSATLRATVDPLGFATDARFLWDDGPELSYETAWEYVGDGEGEVLVTETVPITCNRTYYAKAHATSIDGSSVGGTVSFEAPKCTGTSAPAPFAITDVWVEECDGYGGYVHLEVEYERHPDYTGTINTWRLYHDGVLAKQTSALATELLMSWDDKNSGLHAGQAVDLHISQENPYGVTESNVYSFTIPADCGPATSLPSVETLPAQFTGRSHATLFADVGRHGAPTEYWFEWRLPGDATVNESEREYLTDLGGNASRVHSVIADVPCAHYEFRGVAENLHGTTQGAWRDLRMECAQPAPTASAGLHESSVALWHMDGFSGTLRKQYNAEGTSSRDLYEVGSLASTAGVEGDADGAYVLDGDDHFEIEGLMPPGMQDVTWSFWLWLDEHGEWPLITLKASRYDFARLELEVAGRVSVEFGELMDSGFPPNVDLRLTSNGSIPLQQWTHLAMTREGTHFSLYINGVLDTAAHSSTVLDIDFGDTLSYARLIGAGRGSNLEARIDEVHLIHGRALQAPEIAEDAASKVPQQNVPPHIGFVEPDGQHDVANLDFDIMWADSDESDALVSIAYSTERDCRAAVPLTSVSEDDSSDLYTWDVTGLPDGEYYIAAEIDDGYHQPMRVCSEPILVAGASASGTVLFADNFDDNAIDASYWSTSGKKVVEEVGQMRVKVARTDNGGVLTSSPVSVDGTKPLELSRRVRVNVDTTYGDHFDGRLELAFVGFPEHTFGVSYAHHEQTSNKNLDAYGTALFRNNANSHRASDIDDVSMRVPSIWQTWYDERVVYDPVTGMLEYYRDDVLELTYDVGALPAGATELEMRFRVWGWDTGHYQHMEDITVSTLYSPTP